MVSMKSVLTIQSSIFKVQQVYWLYLYFVHYYYLYFDLLKARTNQSTKTSYFVVIQKILLYIKVSIIIYYEQLHNLTVRLIEV